MESFTTLEAKAPELLGETAVNGAEPALASNIDPEYQETTYKLEYSSEEAAGVLQGTIHTIDGATTLPAVNEELLANPVTVTGLAPGTYYYRVLAKNASGTSEGEVHPFKALAGPIVTTSPAGEPTRTTVTVSGSVTPQGLASANHFAYVPVSEYEAGGANPFTRGRETSDAKLATTTKKASKAANPIRSV